MWIGDDYIESAEWTAKDRATAARFWRKQELIVLEQMLLASGMTTDEVIENRATWRQSDDTFVPPSPGYLRHKRALLQMPCPYETQRASRASSPPATSRASRASSPPATTRASSSFEPPPSATTRASSSFEPPPPATTGPASSSNEHLRGLEQREEGLGVPVRLEMPLRSESPPQRKARRTG